MPEMYLRQPGFSCSACGSIKKKKSRNSSYIYQNKRDKACYQADMAYIVYKDLPKRIVFDRILPAKAFAIAGNQKYACQRGCASIVYKFFDKKF